MSVAIFKIALNLSILRNVVCSQDGEIASLRRNDNNSTFHNGQGLYK